MDRFVWKGVSDNLCEIYRHDSTVVVDEELCSGPGYPANIKAGFAEPVTCSVLLLLDSDSIQLQFWRSNGAISWHPITSVK